MEKFLNIGQNSSIITKKSKNDYLNELKTIAENNNGKLLSTEWEGLNHKYLFSFQDGREFIKNAKDLKRDGWPKDPDMFLKLSVQQNKTPTQLLEEIKKIAENNNGKLISTNWNGTHYKYLFSFQDGREFTKSAKDLKKYGWPKDPDIFLKLSTQKSNIPRNLNPTELFNKLKQLVETNGGKLLSTEWKGSDYKYIFLDKNNTIREKRVDSIKDYLSRQKNNTIINPVKEPINKISKIKQPVKQLVKQSQKKIIPKSQKNGNIRDLVAQRNFNKMVEIAKSHNGKILSKEWTGSRSDYEFIDSENNIFTCKFESLLQGVWSTPRGLVSEPVCKQILEFMFSEKFFKTKKVLTAQVLNMPQALELDGYCSELKIAFEYQGWPGHWDKNHIDYIKINKRDNLKKEYCKNLDIILIEIMPFKNRDVYDENLAFNHVLEAVKAAYLNNGKELPNIKTSGFKLNLKSIHHGNNMLSELKELAKANNGKLLSEKWLGHKHSYLFADQDGVEFQTTARAIKLAGWPKNVESFIANQKSQRRTSFEKFKELSQIVSLNNGKIISEKWLGYLKDHIFETEDGIQFKMRPHNMLNCGWPKKYSKK